MEEDDDELFFIVVPAILECLNDEKRPVRTSEYTGGANKLKEIPEGHGSWCKSELLTRTQCIVSSNHCNVYSLVGVVP